MAGAALLAQDPHEPTWNVSNRPFRTLTPTVNEMMKSISKHHTIASSRFHQVDCNIY